MIAKYFTENALEKVRPNLFLSTQISEHENQQQTNEAFGAKWEFVENIKEKQRIFEFQKKWYLTLYGFETERDLSEFLKTRKLVLDAGSGMGYKSEWFARLAPDTVIVGMDFSDAVYAAAKHYQGIENLFFIKGDIAATRMKDNVVDYVSCDQVLQHTESPEKTLNELVRITRNTGQLALYVYARKALPRELLDDYFRTECKTLSHEELFAFCEQLTELGKRLSELKIEIEVPDLPLLGIKGGNYDLQRFIYWNFIKCFWNEMLGWDNSVATNFDWYSPSNAERYSEEEFLQLTRDNHLTPEYFHKEPACYSGRFVLSKSP